MSQKIDYDALAAQHGGANYDSLATAAGNPAPAANKMGLGSIGGPAALIGAGLLANAAKNKAGAAIQAARSAQIPARARAAAVKTLLKDQGPLGHIVRFIDEMEKSAPSGAVGKVPTRPINVQGKPAARAPAQTAEPPYTGGRGASGPELARRAAARAQAVEGGPPNLKLVPPEMPKLPPAASLEDLLRQNINLAQLTGPSEQGAALRRAVGEAAGHNPLVGQVVFPGNASSPEQELQNAVEQFLMIKHYDPQHYAALLHSIMGPHQ
jgi:hypothetical protein